MQGDSDMIYGINRNASGYYDPTAYKAITNILKDEDKKMEFYQGDIVEFEKNGCMAEAVIMKIHESYSTILVLTDKKGEYSVKCRGIRYTDPGMVQYVFNNRVTGFIRSMSDQEYADILQAVVDSLGYKAPEPEENKALPAIEPETIHAQEAEIVPEELIRAQVERDVYKNLYETLLNGVMLK